MVSSHTAGRLPPLQNSKGHSRREDRPSETGREKDTRKAQADTASECRTRTSHNKSQGPQNQAKEIQLLGGMKSPTEMFTKIDKIHTIGTALGHPQNSNATEIPARSAHQDTKTPRTNENMGTDRLPRHQGNILVVSERMDFRKKC